MLSTITGLLLCTLLGLSPVPQDAPSFQAAPSAQVDDTKDLNHARLVSMIGPKLEKADGSTVETASYLSGKKHVVLYFSAGWCPPCRMFTPDLVKFTDANKTAEDFAVILVGGDRSTVAQRDYMKKYKMNFPAVPLDRAGGLKRTYGGSGIPNLVVLNGEDRVVRGSYETNGKYTPKIRASYIGPQPVLKAFQSMRAPADESSDKK